jgi:hypothetical protein
MAWWHDLKPHPLLEHVPRHTAEELEDLERRVRVAGRIRDPIRLVFDGHTGEREIVDGLGRWEVGKRTGIEPQFEELGSEEEVDVAAVILDYGTRRNISAEQKVRMYMDLHDHSEHWKRGHEQSQTRANAARSESARAQPRAEGGHFAGKPPGAVSGETRPVHRERDRIAEATGTSAATVARVLASRRGASKQKPSWKRLRRRLDAAMRSLGAAAELASDLHAGALSDELVKLEDRARLVSADLEAVLAPKREGGAPPDAGSSKPA